ncbi:MAG: NADH-ubiquinone oxidoreductase-F iron-sulfur binding region domain-containing protein [Solirubrobacteraceae bacterium]
MSAQAETAVATLPRLLSGVPADGAMSFQEHLAIHGDLPPVGSATGRSWTGAALIQEIEQAGLRGRGGGSFPTGVKMRAVASAGRNDAAGGAAKGGQRRPIAVVNGAEGEPASLKDRTLIEALPHLVLDGGVLAARAVGADELIVCIPEDAPQTLTAVASAIAERTRGGDRGIRIQLAEVPARYVTGQETALVNHLNGGPAKPTSTPPMPFERGVRKRPTLVNNPETLAHIALIARYGRSWFRELGTAVQPGSMLVTLWGAVAHQGVYEVESGAPVTSLIEAAGGLTANVRAILVGGYAGGWVDGRELSSLALSDEQLAPFGARVGAGVVALLPDDACGLAESARVLRWLARESAGQCGPCVHGLDAVASAIADIVNGVAAADHQRRLAHLLSIVRGRGACSHPDGTVTFAQSAIEVFAQEIGEHARRGPCERCATTGYLPVPNLHGQSDWRPAPRANGRRGAPLTMLGGERRPR